MASSAAASASVRAAASVAAMASSSSASLKADKDVGLPNIVPHTVMPTTSGHPLLLNAAVRRKTWQQWRESD